MNISFLHHIPVLHGNQSQLGEMISFLKDAGSFGSTQILWEDPHAKVQVGFRISRKLVEERDYYRLPPVHVPKVFLTFLAPQIPTLPLTQLELPEKDLSHLVDVLLKELTYQQRG